MHTLANSEDPDEMPPNAAFHQSLHCLLRQKHFQRKKYSFYLEIIYNLWPLKYAIDQS